MSRPVSGFSPLRPKRPWLRAAKDVATSNSEAIATPLVMLIAAVFGFSGDAKVSQNSSRPQSCQKAKNSRSNHRGHRETELLETGVRPGLSANSVHSVVQHL